MLVLVVAVVLHARERGDPRPGCDAMIEVVEIETKRVLRRVSINQLSRTWVGLCFSSCWPQMTARAAQSAAHRDSEESAKMRSVIEKDLLHLCMEQIRIRRSTTQSTKALTANLLLWRGLWRRRSELAGVIEVHGNGHLTFMHEWKCTHHVTDTYMNYSLIDESQNGHQQTKN